MNGNPRKTIAASDMAKLTAAVAEADTADTAFAAVADAADRFIGHRLFTIMAFDADAMQVQRLYSSNVQAYPVGGWKDKRDTQWGRHVLEEGRPFLGHNAEDIRVNFDDHRRIHELGLESALNIPVRIFGTTIGTMNLLHQAEYYDAADIERGWIIAGQLVGPLSVAAHRLLNPAG